MPADSEVMKQNARHCGERNILLPTFAQLRQPQLIPTRVKKELKNIGLSEVHPLNLFRIGWKNDQQTGLYGGVNHLEIPRELSGVMCRIVGLAGKFFPTGAHKVGATYGCLAPRLVEGSFDPVRHKAAWPSTGNYCRGGAYNSALLGCKSIAILPEQMSQERFEWLKSIGSEIIATPGCESNVKEIYDKCWELKTNDPQVVVLNQFDEFGNGMFHYAVTAEAVAELYEQLCRNSQRIFAWVSATGSAGTLAAGDRLKELYPWLKIVASEALQCPTLLENGYGAHRIEGIGDKHVPWIHNARNTDLVVAIDDAAPLSLMRLFNEPEGKAFLLKQGLTEELVLRLELLGISGIANLLSAIKVARWYELDDGEVIFTVFTDSMELYQSRLQEAREKQGEYTERQAALDWHLYLRGLKTDNMLELDQPARRRIHNLKYYTWIEQQKKDLEELQAQWHEWRIYWPERFGRADYYDGLIEEFNRLSGMAEKFAGE